MPDHCHALHVLDGAMGTKATGEPITPAHAFIDLNGCYVERCRHCGQRDDR